MPEPADVMLVSWDMAEKLASKDDTLSPAAALAGAALAGAMLTGAALAGAALAGAAVGAVVAALLHAADASDVTAIATRSVERSFT
jgi:uncharacterized protein YjbI with pentapeptide repeats